MKKLAFALSAVILSCLVTCTNNAAHEDGTSEKAHKNLENLKAVINMFETGDYSKAGDYIATDGVDHSGPTGEVKGLDNLKAMFAQMGSTMTDVKNEVVKGLADDEYSMVWIKQSWTQKTDDAMMKMKAGDKGNMESVEVCKHGADGKITDHWGFMSMGDAMKMMQQMPKDTSATK